MLHDPCGRQLRLVLDALPVLVDPLDGHGGRALDRHEHLPQRETALVLDVRLVRALRDHGVHEHAVLALVHEDEQPAQDADLGRREPNSCASCMRPVMRSTRRRTSSSTSRPRAPETQRGVAVLPDPRGAIRRRAALELQLVALALRVIVLVRSCSCAVIVVVRPVIVAVIVIVVVHRAGECRRARSLRATAGRRPRPRRGRRGASRARRPRGRAARLANARGEPVFATSCARCLPRSRRSGAGPRSTTPGVPRAWRSSESGSGAGLGARHDDRDEVAEGRVSELLAPRELQREEPRDVVPRRVRTASRPAGRSGRAPARRVPPAPARELRDELERPLLGAEVREREPGVGVDDSGHRDP